MKPNPRLAIAIPTYNRSEILLENLRAMLPELLEHQIAVHISDDSPDDCTAQAAEELQRDFPLLVYRKNEPRRGHDANFFATLGMADTDYVWYLGDSLYFTPGTLGRVLRVLDECHPDFCFVNAYAKDLNSRIIEGPAVHPFLLDRTWYLTLSGATIYGRAPRSILVSDQRKSEWKNFPQLGLILEACAMKPQCLYWLGPPGLEFNRKKNNSYWLKSAFDVFVKDWSAFIRSFPTLLSVDDQDYIIRSHAVKTRLFGPASLFYLRSAGALSIEVLKQHRRDFALASPIHPMWAELISRVPRNIATSLCIQALSIRRRLNANRAANK